MDSLSRQDKLRKEAPHLFTLHICLQQWTSHRNTIVQHTYIRNTTHTHTAVPPTSSIKDGRIAVHVGSAHVSGLLLGHKLDVAEDQFGEGGGQCSSHEELAIQEVATDGGAVDRDSDT